MVLVRFIQHNRWGFFMSKEQAKKLFQALSDHMQLASTDLPAMDFDSEEPFSFSANGVSSFLTYNDEFEEFFVLSYVAPLPAENRASYVRELLEGCYLWAGTAGGILGLDDESSYVSLSLRIPVEKTDSLGFIDRLMKHYDMAKYWQERLQNA